MNNRLRLNPDSPFRQYTLASRSIVYSALFVVPLFLLYEATALLFRHEIGNIRNGADVLLKQVLGLIGVYGFLNVSLVFLAGLLIVIWKNYHRIRPIRHNYFILMFGESVLYALVLGGVVSWIVQTVMLGPSSINLSTQVIISLGAGIYEELLFRVLLVTGLYLLLHRVMGVRTVSAYVIAAVIAAVIFSGFHYIGPLGDTWALHSFLFRLIAGLVLSGLYILRGYGITAYTHTLYDLFVTFRII